jgi:hypothetical protein
MSIEISLQFVTGLRMIEVCHERNFPLRSWSSSKGRGRRAGKLAGL